MDYRCKIITVIVFLTTLIICTLYITQHLQVPSSTDYILKPLIEFNHKNKPYFNPAPAPAPAPIPARIHHVHKPNRHHLPQVPRFNGEDDDGERRSLLLVVGVLVSACGATCAICLVILFAGFKKLRTHNNMKEEVISDPLHDSFYNESLETVVDPTPVCKLKQGSNNLNQKSMKYDEEDEHDELDGFNQMNRLSNSRISEVLITCNTLVPSTSTPAPLPPSPPFFPSSSLTKFTTKTTNFQMKSGCYSGSNQTPIPLPPLPPRFPKGNTPPPPLPPPPSQPTPTGKTGTQLRKLKPLHWDKVRSAPNRSMVWDKMRSSSFEFDEELIESLFSYNQHNTNEELKSQSSSPGKHVLDPKRLQNITILLKALNATAEQVCCALVRGNGLSLQQLEVLIKMEPTKDEGTKITGYKGDLGSAETFLATILMIPYAFQRIEAMLYRETFEDEVNHLSKTFLVLEEACKELRSSRLFLKLLEAVLKMGNRLNIGTSRGGAKAFKLDALLRLADVKGTDGKTTLLHFVVQEIIRSEGVNASESIIWKINQKGKPGNTEDREEDYRNMGLELVGGLSTELCNVKKTASIDFNVIASSVSNLAQGMDRLGRLVNQHLLVAEKESRFVESMKSFLNHAVPHVKELEKDEHKVLGLVKQITEYFHGKMSKDDENPLRIFVIVRDFLAMLDRVCREMRRSKVVAHHHNLVPPFQ